MNSLNTVFRVFGCTIVFVCVSPLLPIVALMHAVAIIDGRDEIKPETAKSKNTNYLTEVASFVDPPSCDSLSFPMAS
jgi:hypothetical protein